MLYHKFFKVNLGINLLQTKSSHSATKRFFNVIGNSHDIESYLNISSPISLNITVFLCHWAQLSIIFMWLSGNLFHIGWNGNYEIWRVNPVSTLPIAHGIWDPQQNSDYTVLCFSGIYNWLSAAGFRNNYELYNLVILTEILSILSLLLARVHLTYHKEFISWLRHNLPSDKKEMGQRKIKASRNKFGGQGPVNLNTKVYINLYQLSQVFLASNLRLNFHVGVLFGAFSLAWCGHLIHCSIPVSRGFLITWATLLSSLNLGQLTEYVLSDKNNHILGSNIGAGKSLLTFIAGLKSDSSSLYLTDITHHHLGLGVILIWGGHLYSAFYKGIGHRIRDIVVSSNIGLTPSSSGSLSLSKSLQLQLCLALAGVGLATSIIAQQMYAVSPYPYLAYDYISTVALYIHHSWIASFLMIGSFVHGALYLIRDYKNLELSRLEKTQEVDVIGRILLHKGALISHLSWCTLWLGFHVLGLYIHNDVVSAFSEADKQILIEPVFAQFQNYKSIFYQEGANTLSQASVGLLTFKPYDSLIIPLTPGDLLVHHAISLGLHTTVLILLKGTLDSSGSKLMPDKQHFGYGFACDGPGRGGTCDISTWDSFYLAMFWMLNTNAWIMFYFHWKHLLVCSTGSNIRQNTVFLECSIYLNGWFRDYLWFNSASLIQGYDRLGSNDLAVWIWLFLAAHLCWATSFMFLISWRGYWQELIEIIIYMHLKTPMLYDLWNGSQFTPVALSIVQARFIGLIHFSVGFILTYAAFIIGATS